MTNVHWDDHYYNWLSGYSGNVAANLSALQSEIAGPQAYKSADGAIPVIVGDRYGNVDLGERQLMQVAPRLSERFCRAVTGPRPGGDKPRWLGRSS